MGNVDPKAYIIEPATGVEVDFRNVAEWTLFEAGSTITAVDYVVNGVDHASGLTLTDEFHPRPAGLLANGIKVTFSAGQPILLVRRFISG